MRKKEGLIVKLLGWILDYKLYKIIFAPVDIPISEKKNIKNLNLLENLGIIPLKSSGNTNNNVLGIAWWILRVCSCWCENQKSPRINVSPNQMGLT